MPTSRSSVGCGVRGLERAFFAGQVLVLRGQSLSPAQFAAPRRLGPPQPRERPVSTIRSFNILILST
jgi:hypothetical protein